MRWRTLGVLLIAVLGLGYLARERALQQVQGLDAIPEQVRLVTEFAPERVTAIRVDNLERSTQLELERDAVGTWYLTDPIAYPASHGVVEVLLRTLAAALGDEAESQDLAAQGLAPPKVVLELTQAPENAGSGAGSSAGSDPGAGRTYRLEVGSVDLEADRVYVRVHDHPAGSDGEPIVVRATRALYSTLDRNADDYREARATSLSAQRVTAFLRSGTVWLPAPEERWVDLELEARRELARWERKDGATVALDPNAMGLLARAAAELRARGFQDDSPNSYAEYGLDPPMFSVRLEDNLGDEVTLLFGFPLDEGVPRVPESTADDDPPPGAWSEIWYCRRLGFDHVWWIEEADVMLLVRPATDLYDSFLVRAKRESMQRVELASAEAHLTLERDDEPSKRDSWWVFETLDGVPGTRYAAANGAVQDLLAVLESTELAFPEDLGEASAVLSLDEDAAASITLVTDDGARWGGRLGGVHRDGASGTVGRTLLRHGDERLALVPDRVAELLELRLDDLRSSRLHRVRPEDVSRVELSHDERRFVYLQAEANDWSVKGSGFPAPKAFVGLTLHLFSMSAARWLPSEPPGIDQVIDVALTSHAGEVLSFRLARDARGELLCRGKGTWAVVDRQAQIDLWGRDVGAELLELFEE